MKSDCIHPGNGLHHELYEQYIFIHICLRAVKSRRNSAAGRFIPAWMREGKQTFCVPFRGSPAPGPSLA